MSEIVWATTFIANPVAILLLLIWLLSRTGRQAPLLARLAAGLIIAGLAGQLARNLYTLITWHMPDGVVIRWWLLKDWGILLAAIVAVRRLRQS